MSDGINYEAAQNAIRELVDGLQGFFPGIAEPTAIERVTSDSHIMVIVEDVLHAALPPAETLYEAHPNNLIRQQEIDQMVMTGVLVPVEAIKIGDAS